MQGILSESDDVSVSSRSSPSEAGSTPGSGHPPSYHTRLCKYYSARQVCAHGERCQFAHGVKELRVEAAIQQVRPHPSCAWLVASSSIAPALAPP